MVKIIITIIIIWIFCKWIAFCIHKVVMVICIHLKNMVEIVQITIEVAWLIIVKNKKIIIIGYILIIVVIIIFCKIIALFIDSVKMMMKKYKILIITFNLL